MVGLRYSEFVFSNQDRSFQQEHGSWNYTDTFRLKMHARCRAKGNRGGTIGRRTSKKRTVNGQRNSSRRKGLVSRTLSPGRRRMGNKTQKGEWKIPFGSPLVRSPPFRRSSGSFAALFQGLPWSESALREESRSTELRWNLLKRWRGIWRTEGLCEG